MRTAICDIAEGTDMGLETGSVPGLSCGLYGSVDFGEDYREVTGLSLIHISSAGPTTARGSSSGRTKDVPVIRLVVVGEVHPSAAEDSQFD